MSDKPMTRFHPDDVAEIRTLSLRRLSKITICLQVVANDNLDPKHDQPLLDAVALALNVKVR